MSIAGENILTFSMIAVLLLGGGVFIYYMVHIRRMMIFCHHRINKSLATMETVHLAYEQAYVEQQLSTGRMRNRNELGQLVEQRLIRRYGDLMMLMGDLFTRMEDHEPATLQYFEDLIGEIDRGGKISRLLKVCLTSNTLKDFGLYGALRVHCVSMMESDFEGLTLTCNDEGYRLPQALEEELMITYLLLFIYYTFDRVPHLVGMELHYDESHVTFTMVDDDPDAPNGLELSQANVIHWPGALRHAAAFAELYHGYAEADTTYTDGLRFTLHIPYQTPRVLGQ
ncbi:hypothetical protein AB9P05_00625 [Roseivirga sp. BDSF3-8]|uniref:hypothetical protein n=1 Tax=Roseivirga sp. BDSF3-8 TaxID=3241598 RepID=UPI003531E1FA